MHKPVNIEALRKLEAKATPGLWFDWMSTVAGPTIQINRGWLFRVSDKGTMDDANLVAALRNAAPALLAELEALRAVVESTRRFTDGIGTNVEFVRLECYRRHGVEMP